MTDEASSRAGVSVTDANDSDDKESVYSEGDFTVEDILDMRITPEGRREFLLKWLDYNHSYNTWSPEADLDCPVLMQAFFDRVANRELQELQERRGDTNEGIPKILGITRRNGQLVFVMKWEGESTGQLVPARHANVLYPQEVIQFYEQRLKFNNNS